MSLSLPPPKEEVEAKSLLDWAHWRIWTADDGRRWRLSELIIHVPNGAYLGADPKTRAITMGKLRSAGVRPGVFDYIIPVPCPRLRYPGLWLELKRLKSSPSDVSDEQKTFEADMQELGWRTQICKGWVQASECIDRYLSCCNKEASPSKPIANQKPGRPFKNCKCGAYNRPHDPDCPMWEASAR